MYPYTVIPSLSQQIVRFLLLNSNFSPFSVSFHYYNINISPRKYFPRISFPSRWYERLMTKHVTDGNIFSRKKGAMLLLEPQKKRNLCRWVRSGLIAWKNGRYEPISRFSSFFNQRQVDDALSRFPASLLLVESWFMGRSFLRERSNLRHPTRYRLLRARYVSVSLFCCFVVLFRRFMQSRRMVRNRRWFWNRCY